MGKGTERTPWETLSELNKIFQCKLDPEALRKPQSQAGPAVASGRLQNQVFFSACTILCQPHLTHQLGV